MASKEELTEQLSVTQKLIAAVDVMARSMAKVEQAYETQISAVEKLTRAVQGLKDEDIGELDSLKLDKFEKTIDQAEKKVMGFSGKVKALADWLKTKFPRGAAMAAGALSGLSQGLSNLTALGSGALGFISSFVSGAFSIGAAILSIPINMFNELVSAAGSATGGSNELAAAMEELRKQMGDFKGPASSAVLETTKTLKGFSDTGLSTWRVFGNLADRLKLVTEVAVAMGATFGVLTKEFRDNGGALLAFQKGLGVTNEQMKAIGDRAITIGKPMTKVFMDMTKQTLALGKAFDIDQKLIGKDMAKALQNVAHFGSRTVKEIAQASVYARKLGLELDKITGTLDAFETFDTAAENAAKLSQAFGVNIDAFKMMEAQGPEEQLEMLRKAFRDAGVDASKFTRAEQKLLSTTIGLDAETTRQAFSLSNYGVSLDKVKKKSEAAEKKTMTQAEAMNKLADSIERLTPSGGGQLGSFWEMFKKGFMEGVQNTKEFQKIMINIRSALMQVYAIGRKLGKAFVEMFPGVKQFFQGIAEFFDPSTFKAATERSTAAIMSWMKELTTNGGKASFPALMEKIQNSFFSFFSTKESSGRKMLEGAKTFLQTFSNIAAEGIRWVSTKIGEGISFISDLVTGKKSLAGLSSATGDTLGFIGEILFPLLEALGDAYTTIKPHVVKLLSDVAEGIYEYVTSKKFLEKVEPALPIVAGILFGPTLVKSLLASATMSIGTAAANLLTKPSTKKIMEQVAENAASTMSTASKKISQAGDSKGAVAQMAASADAAKGPMESKWGVRDAAKLGLKLTALAGAIAVGGVMLAFAVVQMKKILDGGGISGIADAAAPLIILGGLAVAAVPLLLALRLASKAGSESAIMKGGLLITAALGFVGLATAGLTVMMKEIASAGDMSAAAGVLAKMSLVFLAMVPLIYASMTIGALASGPQAVALAAAAIGMGIISSAVANLAAESQKIIKELDALKIGSGFEEKINAFIGIMKSLESFSSILVKMIDMMSPTIGELLSGKTESFTEKVKVASGLISSMIGDSNSGLIGIMTTVIDKIKEIYVGGADMVASAQSLGDLMQGIAEFMKIATPSDAFYEEGGSFINKIMNPSHSFASLATDVGKYSSVMFENLKLMSNQFMKIISSLATAEVPSQEKAGIISTLLNSVSGIMKILTPSPETLRGFSKTKEVSAMFGLVKSSASEFNGAEMAKGVEAMAKNVGPVLTSITSTLLGSIVDQAKGINPEELNAIKVLSDVMTSVSGVVAAIASMAKGKTVTPQEVDGAVHWATEEAPNFAEVFDSLSLNMPSMMDSVLALVQGVKVDKGMTAQIETLKTAFSLISEIPATLKGLGDIGSSFGALSDLNDTISTFTGEETPDASKFGALIDAISRSVGSSVMPLKSIKDILSGDAMDALVGSTEKIKLYAESVRKMSESIKVDGLQAALTAAADIIKSANELDAALAQGINVNTPVKLQKLASAVGMGSKMNYTVTNKAIMIKLDIKVEMNVSEVEKVMIMRKESIIRDRLDFATNTGPGKQGIPVIPQAYQESLENIREGTPATQ